MRVIAVTGGIGSGKSTLTALYRSLGAKVVDADRISRQITAAGGEALPQIRQAFGDAVFQADGTLNRAALGRLVFGEEPRALSTLNAIMHPIIIRRAREALQALRTEGADVVLLDAPLLFETGMDGLADTIVCVTAPEAVRLRRIQRRDRLTREEALRRIRSQNPSAENERRSDYVLSTDAPLRDTRQRAIALWAQMLRDGAKRTPAPLENAGAAGEAVEARRA